MNALSILTAEHDNKAIPTVSGRDLHEALGIQTDFSDWMKRTIKILGLADGVEYLKAKAGEFSPNLRKKGRARIEYHLTVSTAQRIAVGTNTEAGKAIWDYLKKAETIAREEAAERLELERKRMVARVTGKEANRELAATLQRVRLEVEGKESKPFIFSNEATMIDAIALGMNPKDWKEVNGIPQAASIRDHADEKTLRLITYLESLGANILDTTATTADSIPAFSLRKQYLEKVAARWLEEQGALELLTA